MIRCKLCLKTYHDTCHHMTSTVGGQYICEDCKKLNQKNTSQNNNRIYNNNITLQKSREVSKTKNNSALKTHNNESNMDKSNPNNNSQILHKPDQQDITVQRTVSERAVKVSACARVLVIQLFGFSRLQRELFLFNKPCYFILTCRVTSSYCDAPQPMHDSPNTQL